MAYPGIGDYAVIGDCRTVALVSRGGSIDWHCPDRFDAPAVLCRMLDLSKGGFLSVAPAGRAAAERQYRGDTNVLETTFEASGGRLRLTDLMPVLDQPGRAGGSSVLRLIEGLAGDVKVEVRFKPTFDYARAQPSALRLTDQGLVASSALLSCNFRHRAPPRVYPKPN